jgi:2-polyprenyl-3-methyl-5-hydroxy-6-metoxy-1,4-benzoquinol methylase
MDEPGMRTLKSVEELDMVLREVEEAGRVSDDAMRGVFKTFQMVHECTPRSDPHSREYSQAQLDLYRLIAGRDYSSENEASPFVDVESATTRPFPYYTGSCATVGNHLIALGHAIRCLDLAPGSTVLELGPGWGNTTIVLAAMGHAVTAVDIEPRFCELVRRRAKLNGLTVNVINGDFGYIAKMEKPVDAVLFFECFHHASDHVALLQGLTRAVKPGGKVLFAAEPILADFPVPWGLRLDGESLWAIRRNGWLELGFREDYFRAALARAGWVVRKYELPSMSVATVFEARRRYDWSKRYAATDPQIRSESGEKTEQGTLHVKSELPGFFLFGPYVHIPPGAWVAIVRLRATSKSASIGICTYDVCCDGGTRVIASMTIDLALIADDRVSLDFDLKQEASDLEVRLRSDGPVNVDIHEVKIDAR